MLYKKGEIKRGVISHFLFKVYKQMIVLKIVLF